MTLTNRPGRGAATLTLLMGLALTAACAREAPEARLPGPYDKPLEKAEQVEQDLQEAAEARMEAVD